METAATSFRPYPPNFLSSSTLIGKILLLNAERDVAKMESAHAKEISEGKSALVSLDQPYRETRSLVKAFIPTSTAPKSDPGEIAPGVTDCGLAVSG